MTLFSGVNTWQLVIHERANMQLHKKLEILTESFDQKESRIWRRKKIALSFPCSELLNYDPTKDFSTSLLRKCKSLNQLFYEHVVHMENNFTGTKSTIEPTHKVTVNLITDFIETTKHVTITGDLGACTPRQLGALLFGGRSVKRDQVSRILCRNDAYHLAVCKEYMNNFNFSQISIHQALRILMEKLPLLGETQSIERILRCFSTRYYLCNRDNSDMDEDSYHIITCSIMILNNDLHILPRNQKMKLKEYIQNVKHCFVTKTNLPSEELLKDIYVSIKKERLPIYELPKVKSSETIEMPISVDYCEGFEIIKSSTLYYIVYDKRRSFTSVFSLRYSWSLAQVSLRALELTLSTNKPNIYKVFNIAHSYAEYTASTSSVRYKFILYLQDGVVIKFSHPKHDECVDWIMHINCASAVLSYPHPSYSIGNPPMFRKFKLYSQEPYKGKIVDLLDIWTKRFEEISEILQSNIDFKSNIVSKKVLEDSIKLCQAEKSRMLRYINTIKSYDHNFLKKFLHKDNTNGMEGLEEKLN